MAVEFHFGTLDVVYLFGGKELLVFPQVFQVELVGGDACLNDGFDNPAVFFFAGIGLFAFADFFPCFAVGLAFLVLQFKVKREKRLGFLGGSAGRFR